MSPVLVNGGATRARPLCAALALWAAAVLLPALSHATSVRSVAVDDMLAEAELVFEGRVTSVDSFRSPGSTAVRTCVEFEVVDVVKGEATSPLELCFTGGRAAGVTRRVEGLIYPKLGEHGIYFIESTTEQLVNPIFGWKQGHFVVAPDADGTVTTTDGNPVIRVDPSAEAPSGDDRTVYTQDGVARGALVRRSADRRTLASPGMRKNEFVARLRELMAEER